MDKLESNKKAPLYQQLYDAILNKVRSGEYQVGENPFRRTIDGHLRSEPSNRS